MVFENNIKINLILLFIYISNKTLNIYIELIFNNGGRELSFTLYT
jgi:hypothetical protein